MPKYPFDSLFLLLFWCISPQRSRSRFLCLVLTLSCCVITLLLPVDVHVFVLVRPYCSRVLSIICFHVFKSSFDYFMLLSSESQVDLLSVPMMVKYFRHNSIPNVDKYSSTFHGSFYLRTSFPWCKSSVFTHLSSSCSPYFHPVVHSFGCPLKRSLYSPTWPVCFPSVCLWVWCLVGRSGD